MKECNVCQEMKPLSDFYVGAGYKDGYQKRCKECQKKAMRERDSKPYDRERAKKPERKAYIADIQRNRRRKYPEKNRAHCAASRARKNGKLSMSPCIICGNPKTEGHHPDYGAKLDVIWLCFEHHRALHGGTLCLI